MSPHDYDPIITVKSLHARGALALYQSPHDGRLHLDLGNEIVTTSDTDLAPLAKAILNAVAPEALAVDQRTDLPTDRTPLDHGPTTVGTATITISPVLDEDALQAIGDKIQTTVSDALRLLADSLTKDTSAPADEPRYYVEQINGIWGVRDHKMPSEWAAFDTVNSEDAVETARDLNAGDYRADWTWSPLGEF